MDQFYRAQRLVRQSPWARGCLPFVTLVCVCPYILSFLVRQKFIAKPLYSDESFQNAENAEEKSRLTHELKNLKYQALTGQSLDGQTAMTPTQIQLRRQELRNLEIKKHQDHIKERNSDKDLREFAKESEKIWKPNQQIEYVRIERPESPSDKSN